jgi:protein-tyrosine phosphatase
MYLTRRLREFLSGPLPGPRVLLVCAANVCRSPLAAQVLRERAARADAAPGNGGQSPSSAAALHVESAGVRAPRRAERLDPRARDTLRQRGYAAKDGRSRALSVADFERFDLLLAMDGEVLAAMEQLCPPAQRHKLRRFLDYAPGHEGQDVPDPYWGDVRGFEHVVDLCEAAAGGLLDALARERPTNPVR